MFSRKQSVVWTGVYYCHNPIEGPNNANPVQSDAH